jgi:integrase
MATTLCFLSARTVLTLGPGSHADGGNLYLRVKDSGARSWVFRYKTGGRVRELGLGALHSRPLAEARKLAEAMRRALLDGKDPAELVPKPKPEPMKGSTFADCAEALIQTKRPGWRNPKHAQQWENTLRQYAFPVIGHKAPADVTLADVKAILSPLWATKTETATRLRQRIEAVLDYAAVHDLCNGARNPARWKGGLDKVFPAPRKVTSPQHHAAAPYSDVPRIMAELSKARHVSALCLRFAILTAARSGEARGCKWEEIDFRTTTWRIPAHRMKSARPHNVPLTPQALAVLRAAEAFRGFDGARVFPGARGGLLSDVALNKTLRTIAPGVTVHGFRAAFRTWAEEQTHYPRSVTEAVLAHVNADKVEAAYQRSDLFEKRARLMQAWADFVSGPTAASGSVVRIKRRAA